MFEANISELIGLGLTPFFLQQLCELSGTDVVGRVAGERRGEYQVLTATGLVRAALSGRLEHRLNDEERPVVGDWVVLEPAQPVSRLVHRLERQSVLRRVGVDGTSHAQNLAANVDLCCIVAALSDSDSHARARALNPRRIQRYLMLAQSSRVPALVIVNKADAVSADAAEQALGELSSKLPDARALLVSARTGRGLTQLERELPAGTCAVLLGSSGVGKSTLVNALLGREAQRTSATRDADARGRHTTTERQLLQLPSGALLIDTPGMRELALWADAETDTSAGFSDIERLGTECRFRDCSHHDEPGCAVTAAVAAGTLAADRLQQAHKLQRELRHQQARVDVRLRTAELQLRKTRVRAARSEAKRRDK